MRARYGKLWLSPQPDNIPIAYEVVASFEGDGTDTARATFTLPNGTAYDVCSTLQYHSLKPSTNSTSITVKPQTTEGATTLISQEQMQKNAEDNGWLQIWHEFTWSYPWYRFHVKINMNGAIIDVGFSPLLPFGDVVTIENIDRLFAPIPSQQGIDPELAKQIAEETILGTLVEGLGLATLVVAAANTHVTPATIIALAIYVGGIAAIFTYAYMLYTSGNRLKALSLLAGVGINMLGVGFAAFLGCAFLGTASFIADSVAFPILGAVFSNLVDSSPLVVALTSAILTMVISITIGLIILRFVPDPINSWFLPTFIGINFAFAIFAFNLYDSWVKQA